MEHFRLSVRNAPPLWRRSHRPFLGAELADIMEYQINQLIEYVLSLYLIAMVADNKQNMMDFFVLEIEVQNDEDCINCIIDKNQTIIEVDIDGVYLSQILPQNEIIFERDIGFLQFEWKQLTQIIKLSLINKTKYSYNITTGILLYGAPGTGKTMIMKAISSQFPNLCILALNGPDIISTEIGQSERKLKRAFRYVIDNGPGILFIDEIDSILCYDHIKSALIGLMDGFISKNGDILVIAATNKINKIDVSLRRGGLFEEEIIFNIPHEKGRYQILKKLINKIDDNNNCNLILSDDIKIQEIAKLSNGFVGADLDQICKITVKNMLIKNENENENEKKQIKIEQKDFLNTLQFAAPSSIKDIVVEKPNVSWDDIGGLKNVKKQMIEMIEKPLKHNDIFKKYGGNGSRGCLLWGPPGNGKTFLAKAIATKCNTNFIYIKGPELLSKFHGGSEENIRNLFKKARAAAPTILFFDELDALAPIRGNNGNSTTDRVVNQLLAEMDGINKNNHDSKQIFYLGATNRPDIIDPALKRPGRLEQMIFIDLPDEKARNGIFKAILNKNNKYLDLNETKNDDDDDEIDEMDEKDPYQILAQETNGFSGADIKGVIDKAINFIVNQEIDNKKEYKITLKILLNTISTTNPSVTKMQYAGYQKLYKQYVSNNTKKSKTNVKSEYFKPYLHDIRDIKVFIFNIFGKNVCRAQEIYEFLVDPENGGYETLNDLLNTEIGDIDELCHELQIKYGNKMKFKRAIMDAKMPKNQIKNKKNKNKNKNIPKIMRQSTTPNNIQRSKTNFKL